MTQIASKPSIKPLLLLVEDNSIALKMAELIARKADCSYISAGSAELAFELFKEHPVDLIITDINLPGLSGIDLCQQIREYEKKYDLAPVTIMGLSTQALETLKVQASAAGINQMFAKPLNFNQLLNALEHLHVPDKAQAQIAEFFI